MSMKKSPGWRTTLVLIAVLCLTPGPALAATFPGTAGDDTTPTLGRVIIWVEPEFRSLVSALPGWNQPEPGHLTSGTLMEAGTIIGRSAPYADADATDVGGATVGTAATTVKDSDYALVPTVGFQEGPGGTPEVATELMSLHLEDPLSCMAIRAGASQGVSQRSLGEVERDEATPGPDDFPAESFFDIFIEIDAFGETLYNLPSDPLVVVNDSLDNLPPTVVYIHGETPAVPIYWKTGPDAGKRFGFLRLAGHGVYGLTLSPCFQGVCDTGTGQCVTGNVGSACTTNADCVFVQCPIPTSDPCAGGGACASECAQLDAALAAAPLMSCPECVEPLVPTLGRTGLIALVLLMIGATVLVFNRRRWQRA